MQTEKSQPEGKRIMPEKKFTEFPALSVDPRVGTWRPVIDYFFYLFSEKIEVLKENIYNLRCMTANTERHPAFFVTAREERL